MASCATCSGGGKLIGTAVIVEMSFDDGEEPATQVDPATIKVRVFIPGNPTPVEFTETDPEISGGSPDVGLWEFAYVPVVPGPYWVYVLGDEGLATASASQASFKINDTHVPL